MDRIKSSEKIQKQLWGDKNSELMTSDSELYEIMKRFIYGEVWQHGNLEPKIRELIIIAVNITNNNMEQCAEHVEAALNIGISPVEIKETLYQCAPYVGFSKVQNAIVVTNQIFEEKGVKLPLENQSTTTENNRIAKGIEVQKSIFGSKNIDNLRANAPDNLKHIQDYLSGYCFGDICGRNGLDIKIRELITFIIIATLGGCENQLRAHIGGNAAIGNDKETLLNVITQCMPYIGFPRTLNAITCINEVLK
ncbi:MULTISPECIES: carboxymuconolactone decarboxylase family protein [Clostridium]|uniref:carboxymuconolactone decarboxylase family protein n=1 Tax=Clostridium TaxID=1485 RepID=UPI00051C4188|nr:MULTISPECIES: carboxymuconolactone decarboxylase family protein [Clostridium]MDB2139298.1 carboxymuconolactone decarboxylase family protein [Clostridium butyricum]MDB2156564.1 carboxymuconolactone decarboxylase family protein [Clostridium butyricum]MDI9208305.1 carboxymuconolactone decarboxylase family protein [Clostridium butyricum]MDU1116550.1 carboxymuconolactone decarboxylase family protein [Clostridium sp.]MDU1339682.1 carboxymuconolactone decarboxylase family protein [Clostridium buty